MKIATWNVNGIRARAEQFVAWEQQEHPDVICLQEIKATVDQVPAALRDLEGYWCCWHGTKGYSGVGLHVARHLAPEKPDITVPSFDFECRIATVRVGCVVVASVYVPNGGKDYAGKVRFLRDLEQLVSDTRQQGLDLVLCGDLNVTRSDMDVHPRERKPNTIGQLPEERDLLARLLEQGMVDVGRTLDPDNAELYTWWAPWRNMRQKNIGWRIDYILASEGLARRATACRAYRETGTSDHAPVVAVFDSEAAPGGGAQAHNPPQA